MPVKTSPVSHVQYSPVRAIGAAHVGAVVQFTRAVGPRQHLHTRQYPLNLYAITPASAARIERALARHCHLLAFPVTGPLTFSSDRSPDASRWLPPSVNPPAGPQA